MDVSIFNKNPIDVINLAGKVFLGKEGGYFWSPYSENELQFPSGYNIDRLLDEPEIISHGLGKCIRNYQNALLKLEKGGELSSKDTNLISFLVGAEVTQPPLQGGCDSTIRLSPFNIYLKVEATDIETGEVVNAERAYEARNVLLGCQGFLALRDFGINYLLVSKKE